MMAEMARNFDDMCRGIKEENHALRLDMARMWERMDQPSTSNAHFRAPGINLPTTSCHGQYRPPFPPTRPSSPTSSTVNDVLIQTRLHQNKAFKQALAATTSRFNGLDAQEYVEWKRTFQLEVADLQLNSTQVLQLLEARTEMDL